ncbi:VCBS domain-containing protein [Acinetobacter towneri]|uniref:VCBS domain-containing protein n=2 Tax=Acinetobacter towneri TaxID=202956 RepID=UPI002934CC7E|nr:VCBS domain-containing protein [Acinetobacter towneri]WOE28710.1 VCBS domain-containing protein [Acinetobacter towneri]
MPWVASALPAQGHGTYTVANADVQYLGAGQTKVETFTVLSADGTSHDIVITITGTNDVPVIAGDDTGAVTEDASTPNLTDTGTLTIVDADGGQAVFQTTGITSSAGALGSLSITSAGAWVPIQSPMRTYNTWVRVRPRSKPLPCSVPMARAMTS